MDLLVRCLFVGIFFIKIEKEERNKDKKKRRKDREHTTRILHGGRDSRSFFFVKDNLMIQNNEPIYLSENRWSDFSILLECHAATREYF